MSDSTSPVTDNKELQILVNGTSERIVIRDKKGADHVLQPLDLADLCEYEEKLGRGLLATDSSGVKFRDIAFLLYLSLRKENKTAEDVEARRWAYTERQVYMLFDLSAFTKSSGIFVDILRISGLDANPPKAN